MSEAFTQDRLPWNKPTQVPTVEWGTVGHDDADSHYDIGTAENDGYTIIRVTLFRGKNLTTELKPGVAQGTKIYCLLGGGIFRIPPKGTRVLVAIPAGMQLGHINGVILTTVEKNPVIQFNDDRAQLNFGDDAHLVIRAKSVTITDPGNRFMMIGTSRAGGTPCILFQDETGSGGGVQAGAVAWFAASGGTTHSILQIKSSAIEGFQADNGGSCFQLSNGGFIGVGITATLQASAVYLGKAPLATSPVLYGVAGPSGVPSPSVFVSPV